MSDDHELFDGETEDPTVDEIKEALDGLLSAVGRIKRDQRPDSPFMQRYKSIPVTIFHGEDRPRENFWKPRNARLADFVITGAHIVMGRTGEVPGTEILDELEGLYDELDNRYIKGVDPNE